MNIREQLKIQNYNAYIKKVMPKSNIFGGCIRAFLVGGAICTVGQALRNFAEDILQLDTDGVGAFTSIVLILCGAVLTGLGWYDVLGNFAGAGSIVPITGFSNSVSSPALEFRAEGMVLGMAAKMFVVAGPVIVYGTLASGLYGVICWITTLF